MDDPILTAASSHEERQWLFNVVILFWEALGFKLRWKGGETGSRLGRIGGELVSSMNFFTANQLVSFMGYRSWTASVAPRPDLLSRCWRRNRSVSPTFTPSVRFAHGITCLHHGLPEAYWAVFPRNGRQGGHFLKI